MSFTADKRNSYMVKVTIRHANVQREMSTGLHNLDTSIQNLSHKDKMLTSTLKLLVTDWAGTQATETRGRRVLVEDPLKDAKKALDITNGVAASKPNKHPELAKPVGSKIRLGDVVYTLLDEPERAKKLLQMPLHMIGKGATTCMMAPANEGANSIETECIELFLGSADILPRFWLEESAANAHMKQFILDHQSPLSLVLAPEALDAMTSANRSTVYSDMKKQAAIMNPAWAETII